MEYGGWSLTSTMVQRWLHTQHFKVLLLEVISDQQHLQQQHLNMHDVVVGGHFRPTPPPTTTPINYDVAVGGHFRPSTPPTTTFIYLWCRCWRSFPTNKTSNNNKVLLVGNDTQQHTLKCMQSPLNHRRLRSSYSYCVHLGWWSRLYIFPYIRKWCWEGPLVLDKLVITSLQIVDSKAIYYWPIIYT